MSDYNVVSKGTFNTPQNGTVRAVNYIFIREDNAKYILLSFENERDETLTGMDLCLTQKTAAGITLEVTRLQFDNVNGNGEFVLDRKIRVNDKCAKCEVVVTKSFYGQYSYSAGESGMDVDYLPEQLRRENAPAAAGKTKSYAVTERKFKGRLLTAIFAGIMLVCAFLFTYFQLNTFKDESSTFLNGGVEYAFENDNRQDGSAVYVLKYDGDNTAITIPDNILGHPVSRIAADAFRDNTVIRAVRIEARLEIGDRAFYNCPNLTGVEMENVMSVGEQAFYNCISLESVATSNLRSMGNQAFHGCTALTSVQITSEGAALELGGTVFDNCTRLKDVTINQQLNYGEDVDIFRGSYNIENLTIANLPSSEDAEYTVVNLFGTDSSSIIALKNLTITNLGKITNGFCDGMNVEKVTITNLESAEIGNNAFRDCTALTTLSLPLDILKVGERGFYNSGITSFKGESLVDIGPYAFAKCAALKDFSLENNVELQSIGTEAFRECASLERFYVPEQITVLDGEMFSGCTSLRDFYIDSSFPMIKVNDGMFENCSSLVDVVLPSSVTEVGSRAFRGCSLLASFRLTQIQTIGSYAFAQCVSLTNVTIPETVINIGKGAYQESGVKLLSVPFIGGSESFNRYLGYIFGSSSFYSTDGVPQSLENITVTGGADVPEGAFYKFENVKSITLSDTITRVSSEAFSGCTNLVDLYVPQNISIIASKAFNGCASLASFPFPEALETIGSEAFAGCSGLWDIALPDGMVSIGANAFAGCDSLQTYKAPFIGGDTGTNTAISYVFGEALPETLIKVEFTKLTEVPSSAFMGCTSLKTVVLNEGVTRIGAYAFDGCTSLSQITMPEAGLTQIAQAAFNDCKSLSYVTLPESLRTLENGAFAGCYRLYEVRNNSSLNVLNLDRSLQETVIKLYSKNQDNAPRISVNGYTLLKADKTYLIGHPASTDLVLPEKMSGEDIGDYCIAESLFRERKIGSVSIPACVVSIGEYAFEDSTVTRVAFANNSRLTELGKEAFSNCASLTSIILPAGVATVPDKAFYNCEKLASVIFAVDSALQEIGPNAFAGCGVLKSVTFPDGLQTVGGYAFSGCKAITEAVFSSALATLGERAFEQCSALQKVEFDSQCRLYQISPNAFAECISLTSIALPSGVRSIGEYAFSYCSSLRSVELPAAFETIGQSAFVGCTDLRIIYNYSTRLRITAGATDSRFGSIAEYAVYVITDRETAQNLIQVTINGVEYAHIKGTGEWAVLGCGDDLTELNLSPFSYEDEEVETFVVAPSAFLNNQNLTKVTLAGISKLGKQSFYNSASLVSVEFGECTLTELPSEAFRSCAKLESVVLPESATSIGENCFADCALLNNVSFPDKLKTIGAGAFSGCSALETLDLNKVSSVGASAFAYNTSLKVVKITESVQNVGANAFTGCNVVIVYNLGRLKLTERGSELGGVALNAIKIFGSADDTYEFASQGDFEFACLSGEWFVYNYVGSETQIELPDSFTSNGQTITEYGIKGYTFKSQLESITLPAGLTRIEANSFSNGGAGLEVFFKGDRATWNGVDVKDKTTLYVTCADEV